jgi:hypothetical protein
MIYRLGGICDELVSDILEPLSDGTKLWVNAIIPVINIQESLL